MNYIILKSRDVLKIFLFKSLIIFPFLVFISCTSQPLEFTKYQEVLTNDFTNYEAVPANIKYNKTGDLEIYYNENYQEIISYNKLRKAAILLIDSDSLLEKKEQIIFKFRSSEGSYFDMPYEIYKLNQNYTKSLNFDAPHNYLGNHDTQDVIKKIADSAGKGNPDGINKPYYFLEAGFAYVEGNVIKYFARGAHGSNQFEKELPMNLKFSMSRKDVKSLLGEPENDSNVTFKYNDGRVSILFMDDKIHFIELYEESFAKMLKDKYAK